MPKVKRFFLKPLTFLLLSLLQGTSFIEIIEYGFLNFDSHILQWMKIIGDGDPLQQKMLKIITPTWCVLHSYEEIQIHSHGSSTH